MKTQEVNWDIKRQVKIFVRCIGYRHQVRVINTLEGHGIDVSRWNNYDPDSTYLAIASDGALFAIMDCLIDYFKYEGYVGFGGDVKRFIKEATKLYSLEKQTNRHNLQMHPYSDRAYP